MSSDPSLSYFHMYQGTGTPIFKLNSDLMWHIFSLAVPDFNDDPDECILLDEARRFSQVCQSWREIVLASPSIWGRCIDLDILGQDYDDWRDLVLERTGQSLLSVRGARKISLHKKNTVHTFLARLLTYHWDRIRDLDVFVGHSILNQPYIWDVFSLPTQNLRSFSVRSDTGYKPKCIPSNFELFSGYAPSLTSLSLPRKFRFRLDITAPGIFTSGLRNLRIDQPLEIMSGDLLAACAQMPSLETLWLTITRLIVTRHQLKTKTRQPAPNLTLMDIHTPDMQIYDMFLDRIAIPARCSLLMHHSFDSQDLDTIQGLQHMTSVIQRHVNAFFAHHGARPDDEDGMEEVRVHISNTQFSFDWNRHTLYFRLFVSSLTPNVDLPAAEVHAPLLNCAAGLVFPSSVKLAYLTFGSQLPPELPLGHGFHCLRNITRLLLSIPTLSQLGRLPDCGELFPLLDVLCIPEEPSHEDRPSSANMMPFLTQRHKPLECITFAYWPIGDLQFLEELTGLTLFWTPSNSSKVGQYVCGSGGGQALILDNSTPWNLWGMDENEDVLFQMSDEE